MSYKNKCVNCGKKIPNNARFCPYCQFQISNSKITMNEINSAKNKSQLNNKRQFSAVSNEIEVVGASKKRIIVLVGIMISMIVLIIVLLLTFFATPVSRAVNALDFKNYSEAVEIINNISEVEDNQKISETLQKTLDKIYDDYYEEKVKYDKTADSLEALQGIQNNNLNQIVVDCYDQVDILAVSRQNYNDAQTLINQGSYADAINKLRQVEKCDKTYYQEAQQQINVYMEKYKSSELERAEKYYEKSDFSGAIEVIESAMRNNEFSDDTEFLVKCESAKSTYVLEWIDSQKEKENYFGGGDDPEEGAVSLAYRYNIESADLSFDLEKLVNEGCDYEETALIKCINDKREKLGMEKLTNENKLQQITEKCNEIFYNQMPVSSNSVRSPGDYISDSSTIRSQLNEDFPEWDIGFGRTSVYGYMSGKSFFEGDDPYYKETTLGEYGEFDSSYNYIGVDVIYDEISNNCYWLIITTG